MSATRWAVRSRGYRKYEVFRTVDGAEEVIDGIPRHDDAVELAATFNALDSRVHDTQPAPPPDDCEVA